MPEDMPAHERTKILMDVIAQMEIYTRDSMAAIYGVIAADEGELVGSGTFIKYKNDTFLLTACHVVEKVNTDKYIGGAHSNKMKTPSQIYGSIRMEKTFDFAAIPIDTTQQENSQVSGLDLNTFANSSAGLANDILYIHGFPGQQSKFLRIAEGVISTPLSYGTFLGTSDSPGFDPAIHLAIDYKPIPQIDINGKPIDLPDPHGLSGAALWKANMPRSGIGWEPSLSRIVGMIQKWDPNAGVLIATRIEPLRLLVDRYVCQRI